MKLFDRIFSKNKSWKQARDLRRTETERWFSRQLSENELLSRKKQRSEMHYEKKRRICKSSINSPRLIKLLRKDS